MLTIDRTILLLPLFALLLLAGSGCSLLNTHDEDDLRNRLANPDVLTSAAGSADVYMKVRQARAQNSIVLQVADEGEPIRILPLPDGGRSVFVSTLLEQTGVQKKLGNISVTVHRSSVDTIDGIVMNVKMTSDGKQVRPESDYALQPGDRIRVSKREFNFLETLLGIAS